MAKRNAASSVKFVTMFLLIAGGVAVLSWQTAAIVAIGLFPSLILVYTGSGRWKTEKLQCVFLLNVATIIPFAFDMWQEPENFMYTVTNPVTVIGMYSGAVMGYIFIFIGPVVAAAILQVLAKDRLRKIAQNKKALIAEWGNGLALPDNDAVNNKR
jgi:hypothetical protein